MDKAKRNRRARERLYSLRDIPITYEFNDHPLQPRFTMHRRGELSVSIQGEGSLRRYVGIIAKGVFYPTSYVSDSVPPEPESLVREKAVRDELLALGESVYNDLRDKYERKQQREKGQF